MCATVEVNIHPHCLETVFDSLKMQKLRSNEVAMRNQEKYEVHGFDARTPDNQWMKI
jgi:hypothetical protein